MARDPKAELARMKRSLRQWLKFREMNSRAGLTPAEMADRTQVEAALLVKLQALMTEIYGSSVRLPNNAVLLADMIIRDEPPGATSPTPQGILPFVVVVGAIALVLMTGISSYADYAKERERYACIEKHGAWACDTSGQIWKWGVIAGIAYLAWSKFGVRELVGRFRGGKKA